MSCCAAGRRVRDEIAVGDRLEDGDPRGAGDGVAAVGRAMGALAPALLEVAPGGESAQRQAVGDRLGDRHRVGHDPGVLERPHPAGPAVAGLDLVGDEQDPVLVAEGAQLAQERDRCRLVAALALDRLDEDRCHARGRHDERGQPAERVHARLRRERLVAREVAVDRREGRQVHRGQERLVAGPIVQARARDRGRPERPTVEGALEGDDRRPAGRPSGELERRLDRLRPGVQEEDRVDRVGQRPGEHLGQDLDRLGVADRARRPDEPVDLGVDRGRDRRVMVTQAGDGDAVREVEVAAPGGVVQPVALAVAPADLEVAAEDRRKEGRFVRRGRRLEDLQIIHRKVLGGLQTWWGSGAPGRRSADRV